MMQSIAITLICIIVKLYDCTVDGVVVVGGDDDRSAFTMRIAAPMPPAIVSDGDLLRIANEWQPAANQRSAIHQNFVNLYANFDGGNQMLDKSSQPNKHDIDKTVMNQANNNANYSRNRSQRQRIVIDDDDVDLNGTRTSRNKRESDQRQDICDTQCVCRYDVKFLTVECNFKQVSRILHENKLAMVIYMLYDCGQTIFEFWCAH